VLIWHFSLDRYLSFSITISLRFLAGSTSCYCGIGLFYSMVMRYVPVGWLRVTGACRCLRDHSPVQTQARLNRVHWDFK
jgi:hypothetical protein